MPNSSGHIHQGCGLHNALMVAILFSLSHLFSGAVDYGQLVRILDSECFHGLRLARAFGKLETQSLLRVRRSMARGLVLQVSRRGTIDPYSFM
jgi:hypothetical protein